MMTTDICEQGGQLAPALDVTSDALLSMVLDGTSDGVLLASSDGTIVYVNQPLLELFGYDATELIGQPIEVLVPQDLRDGHRHHVEGYAGSPRSRPMGREDLDIEGRRADGSTLPVDVQLNIVPGTSMVVATVRDMTAQRAFTAESAIGKIDLARARSEADQLRATLDLVIQRLFGLGMSLAAGASSQAAVTERVEMVMQGIDHIIEAAQAAGPATTRP
jgi:PAS domain S-box-containing protein